MTELIPIAAFWLCASVLFYTFAGYGLHISLLARWHPRPDRAAPTAHAPEVCVVLVAHNEEARIVPRLENLLASDYPPEKLRVLVVSDGSTDATVARIEALRDPRIAVLARPERGGKAACLNAGLAQSAGEIIVLADARQRFAADAIARLAAHFADAEIGAVSGALEIERSGSSTGAGVDAYWRYEKRLRAAESRLDSCIGCTGAVYAIRRALFTPIPADTILDDVVIPMQIAVRGHRVLFDTDARAFDPQPLEPAAERIRKRRTLAGNYQMLFRYPGWLLPWRDRLWWQLLAHKYLRILAPAFLLGVFVANLLLLGHPLYRVTFAGQCVFYILAALGSAFPQLKARVFSLPAGFVFLNLTSVRALLHYLTSADLHRWGSVAGASSRGSKSHGEAAK